MLPNLKSWKQGKVFFFFLASAHNNSFNKVFSNNKSCPFNIILFILAKSQDEWIHFSWNGLRLNSKAVIIIIKLWKLWHHSACN